MNNLTTNLIKIKERLRFVLNEEHLKIQYWKIQRILKIKSRLIKLINFSIKNIYFNKVKSINI